MNYSRTLVWAKTDELVKTLDFFKQIEAPEYNPLYCPFNTSESQHVLLSRNTAEMNKDFRTLTWTCRLCGKGFEEGDI